MVRYVVSDLLFFKPLAEPLILYFLRLLSKSLTNLCIFSINFVLMRHLSLAVHHPSLKINLSLPLFVLFHFLFMPLQFFIFLIAALFNHVGKLAVFVCDLDLLLQALFFVVKFAETVLKHLGLKLFLLKIKPLLELA